MSFEKLSSLAAGKSAPIAMGLDPRLEYIPDFLRENVSAGEAIFNFNRALIDCAADLIPAVKPQSAFYEMYGLEGMAALEKTIKYAKEAGLYVILDAKRGDIGTTAEAYAEAVFGESSPGADCVTVNGYLGSDGVLPFLKYAKRYDKAIFVLVKTSNPSSCELQDMDCGGIPLYRRMGELVEKWGADSIGESGYSRAGAVVGATHPKQLIELRACLPHTFFLIPGYGAQGGKAEDINTARDKNGGGIIVNSSRGLMCAYKGKGDDRNFQRFTREAVLAMAAELSAK